MKGAPVSKRHIRYATLVVLLSLMAAGLTGCWWNEKDVHASSQFYTCIYDHEDGTLIKALPPGGGKVTVEDDAEVWRVPTTQRFWNVDPNPDVKDPGTPDYITGVEASYKPVQMVAHAKLYFNQKYSCDWIDVHGKRNVPSGIAESDEDDKLGFNIRNDEQAADYGKDYGINTVAQVPWFKWLNENVTTAMQSRGEPLLRRYAWPYFDFNFPANADLDGVLPCKQQAQPASQAGQPTPVSATCAAYEEPEPIVRDLLEPEYGQDVTDELKLQLGDKDYFCGPGYDPANPDVCPPIAIEIVRIELVDKAPVAERQRVIDLREQTENDAREAQLISQATEAETARRKAELDQEQALRALEAQYGGVTPEIADAQRQADLARITALVEAQQKVAPCQALGVTDPQGCALILAALSNQYPQGGNTSVQVNPGPNG
jgi:hypothetical protein